jgi:hypothetical protein
MLDDPQVKAQEATTPETTSEPLGLEKKYGNNPELWDRSYWELNAYKGRLEQENEELRQMLNTTMQTAGRQDPMAARAANQPEAAEQLRELGVDPALIEKMIDERAGQRAYETMTQYLGPMANSWQGREYVAAKHRDYTAHEGDIMAYVNSDPQLRRMYQAVGGRAQTPEQAAVAMEWAALKWKETQAPAKNPVRAEARGDAGLPGGAPASVTQVPAAQALEDRIKAAQVLATRTGDHSDLYTVMAEIADRQKG